MGARSGGGGAGMGSGSRSGGGNPYKGFTPQQNKVADYMTKNMGMKPSQAAKAIKDNWHLAANRLGMEYGFKPRPSTIAGEVMAFANTKSNY